MAPTARLVKRMNCFTVRTTLGRTVVRRREDARLYKISPPLRKHGNADYVVVTVFYRDTRYVVGVYPADANGVAGHIGLVYERSVGALGTTKHPHAAALEICGIEYDGDSITEAVVDEVAKEPR